jgi:mycothiol synthase
VTTRAELITRSATLSTDSVDRIRALAAQVESSDGAPPLDEQAELRLTHAPAGVEHIVLRRAGTLSGYVQFEHAQLEHDQLKPAQDADGDPAEPAAAEILVGIDGARPQIAATLFDQVEDAAGPVLVWARGDGSPVRAEAERRGYQPVRTLLTMARALADIAPNPRPLPDAVTIRAFVPGQDDAAWLGVNARAFATHPEQGRWTQSDLDDRIAQPWFDPAGFLLAVADDGHLLGFHWTKRHSPQVGEVYVIGMDPSAQGRGLGRTLLLAGLDYLQRTGAETVILYTDEENQGAVRLYESTGFAITRRQTQYRGEATAGASTVAAGNTAAGPE